MPIRLTDYYRRTYGCKVYKLGIDAGFTCPNRDGTLSHGGCSFCSAAGGGDFAEKRCVSISEQLEKAKARVAFKNRNGKYIASFIGFAPVDNPQVIAMCIIDEPEGIYYGGTIAAPVIKTVFENILPYLGIEKTDESLYTN